MKIVQQEAMKLHQYLGDMKEAEEKAKEVQNLSTALEITTASKMDVVIAAEKLRNAKQKINCRLQELKEQLSQEISLRESLEEFQATVMCHVQDMETTVEAEWKQVEPLCKALESAIRDNKKLVFHLEEVLQVNNTLQSKLIQIQYEMKSKETEHQQLSVCREQLTERDKTEEKMYAEHTGSLKKQFQTEQEASRKAACQESAEVKKALEESSSKLAEVSLTNKELRQKVVELEKSLPSYWEKLKSQRAQVGQCLAYKANTEKVKETECKLRKMEAVREEYQKKNYEQLQDIQKFLSELESVQSKMPVLPKNQQEVQVQNRQLETQLEVERRRRQQLDSECQKREKTVKHLKKYKEETEKKLKEASIESEQEKKQEEHPTHTSLTSRARPQHFQLSPRKAHVNWAGNELT